MAYFCHFCDYTVFHPDVIKTLDTEAAVCIFNSMYYRRAEEIFATNGIELDTN